MFASKSKQKPKLYMTDEIAMNAVKQGELDQAAVLYERYKRPIFNFFLYLRHDRELSQDFTQQVFYRLLKYRNSYQEGNCFKTWIYRIARNIHHDHYQRNLLISNEFLDQYDKADEIPDNQDEELALVTKALNKLPNEYREVLILSRYEDMKYEQIAAVLDISVALVKVRVHRAIKALREVYFQLSEA